MTPHDLWERYMRCYDGLMGLESYVSGLREIAATAAPRPGERVLDAGSGTGNLSLLIKQQGARVVSCDFSASAMACHRRKDPRADQVLASLEDPLPWRDAGFDAICCASVLFALSKAGCERAVREFFRVLRPGGRLIVTVASPEKRNRGLVGGHLRSTLRGRGPFAGCVRLLRQLPALVRVLYYNHRLQHLPDWQGYHRFTEEELRALLCCAGFTALRIRRTYAGRFFLVEGLKPFNVVLPRRSILQKIHGMRRGVRSA